MKTISLALLVAITSVFMVASISAEGKADVKKCMAAARGKKYTDSKACYKLKGAERKECRKKADQTFEAAKAACEAK
ncbi:MAG: hypothetical protein LDLANPLL_02588 [Turneriella sp.]|nr:hypothetical protein [Turneriella sp.]